MLKQQSNSVANTQNKGKNGVDSKLRKRRWQLKTYKQIFFKGKYYFY